MADYEGKSISYQNQQDINMILLDSLPYPAVIINKERIIVATNQLAEESGSTQGDYCWCHFANSKSEKDICSPCLAEDAFRDKMAKQDEVSISGEVIDKYWVPLNDDMVLHYIINTRDHHKIIRDLKKTNTALFKILVELHDMQMQASQHERLSALGEMAGGITHDFNNALMPIVGLSEFLLSNKDVLDDRDELISVLKTMTSAAHDAQDIVRRLREFYHPDEELDIKPVNIKDIVEQVIELTRPKWKVQAESNGRKIDIKIDIDNIPSVMANEVRMREVFTNLFFNAIDSMPDGGVIKIKIFCKSSWIVIKVSDTGKGMNENVRMHCFDPFFSTKGKDGTGMGLTMIYGIIRNHKGRIDVQSRIGKGTTVTIHLPLGCSSTSAENKEKKIFTKSLKAPLNVLVIDDEYLSRKILLKFLEADGHIVKASDTGKDGIDEFRKMGLSEIGHKTGFDLVITDLAMPDISGDTVAMAIKNMDKTTPIIILTGFDNFLKERKDVLCYADRIVSKPVTQQELRDHINSIVKDKKIKDSISLN